MKRSWLPLLGNFFLAAYALDGVLSLGDESLRALTGSEVLLGLRNALAQVVWYAAPLVFLALLLTPRLPVAIFLPLVLSTFWLNLGAAPLPLVVRSAPWLGLVIAAIQVAIAAVVLLWIRRRRGARGWLLAADDPAGPALSLRHSLGFAAFALLVLAPVAAAYLLVWVATWIQVASDHFVSFDLAGVTLSDRRFVRDDREIRLVGMMHIGEEDAYREIAQSFVRESTVVLAEGVSDEEEVLVESLSYQPAAEALGLSAQDDLRSYLAESAADGEVPEWPVVRHADLDASEFSPETLEFLDWVAEVYGSESLFAAILRIGERVSERPEEIGIVERDIFERRNQHLIGEIEAVLPTYERVVIPWGALHLPAIQHAILERGFDRADTSERRLVSWRTVVGSLF